MPYSDDALLVRDGPFGERIRLAMIKTGQAVASEAATTKPNVDTKRHVLAVDVLNGPETHLFRFTIGAIVAGSLINTSSDTALNNACSAIWNGLSGVSAADLA